MNIHPIKRLGEFVRYQSQLGWFYPAFLAGIFCYVLNHAFTPSVRHTISIVGFVPALVWVFWPTKE